MEEMEYGDPAYVEVKPIRAALMAGFLGAVLLFIIQQVLHGANVSGPPTAMAFVDLWLGLEGAPAIAIGLLLFSMAGAAWAVLYVFLVEKISPTTGAAFGLVPWLAVMMVLLPFMDRPAFAGGDAMGILLPLVMNVIWGAFIGAVIPALPFGRQVWLNDRA